MSVTYKLFGKKKCVWKCKMWYTLQALYIRYKNVLFSIFFLLLHLRSCLFCRWFDIIVFFLCDNIFFDTISKTYFFLERYEHDLYCCEILPGSIQALHVIFIYNIRSYGKFCTIQYCFSLHVVLMLGKRYIAFAWYSFTFIVLHLFLSHMQLGSNVLKY